MIVILKITVITKNVNSDIMLIHTTYLGHISFVYLFIWLPFKFNNPFLNSCVFSLTHVVNVGYLPKRKRNTGYKVRDE